MKNPNSVKATLSDRAYWRKLGRMMGWRVYGWDLRSSGTFYTGHGLFEVPGWLRDAIMAAIERARSGK